MVTEVIVRSPFSPSEDPEKVRKAILNIFPNADLEDYPTGFEGTADLNTFSKLIRNQKILDSTRSMMTRGWKDGRITLYLNKQVATVGIVSFAEARAILGNIEVVIFDDDLEELIDIIAPETVDGEEVRRR